MEIPGDKLHRSWVAATIEKPHDYDNILLTLVTNTPDGLIVVGNAFVIYANANMALCLTAAHNFEFIKQIHNRSVPHSHPSLPPDFRYRGPKYMDSDPCAGFCRINGEVYSCKIDQFNYIENYDVALFTARLDELFSFDGRVAIDLGMPAVGDEVAVLGHTFKMEKKTENSGIIQRDLQLWFGVVTSVTPGLNRKQQYFSFETTIPILPGMSGSPIMKKPSLNAVMTVCGVVSFDFSEANSFTDFTISGHSTHSMVWPAMGLGFKMRAANKEPAPHLLGDLLVNKILEDRSSNITVETKATEKRIQILYTDHNTDPAWQITLDTTPHPLESGLQVPTKPDR